MFVVGPYDTVRSREGNREVGPCGGASPAVLSSSFTENANISSPEPHGSLASTQKIGEGTSKHVLTSLEEHEICVLECGTGLFASTP